MAKKLKKRQKIKKIAFLYIKLDLANDHQNINYSLKNYKYFKIFHLFSLLLLKLDLLKDI